MTDWRGLYKEGWQGEIVPEAFSHPAKFARGLIRRIYQHALEEGWLREGDTVVDPFGGVALGALDAMTNGLNWRGVELEARFCDLGAKNIAVWHDRYGGKLPRWGSAELLQGDSRQLAQVLGQAESCSYGVTPGNLGNLHVTAAGLSAAVSSPPYAEGCAHTGGDDTHPEYVQGGEIRLPGIVGAISSPPYAESIGNADQSGIDWSKQSDRETDHPHGWNGERYGTTPGQLGAMKAGGFNAAVSSPPYSETRFDGGLAVRENGFGNLAPYSGERADLWRTQRDQKNLGNNSETDFWSAARLIVEQVYQVLAPGAHAIWVCKRFVKDKRIVEFSQQWAQLCEAVGLQVIHWHRAWLVEDNGTQLAIIGDDQRKVKKRYSFFRRLHAQKYPALEIQWEDVICMVKSQG